MLASLSNLPPPCPHTIITDIIGMPRVSTTDVGGTGPLSSSFLEDFKEVVDAASGAAALYGDVLTAMPEICIVMLLALVLSIVLIQLMRCFVRVSEIAPPPLLPSGARVTSRRVSLWLWVASTVLLDRLSPSGSMPRCHSEKRACCIDILTLIPSSVTVVDSARAGGAPCR